MAKEEYVTITINGTLNQLEPLLNQCLEVAIKNMNGTKTIEEAKKIWNKWQVFHRYERFKDAKEEAKRRLGNTRSGTN